MDEPWRTLGYVAPGAVPPPEPSWPEASKLGTNAAFVRANLADMQEARRRNLMKDFTWLKAYEITPTNWIVWNARTMGRYEIDMNELVCNCRDSFYSYTDEGSGLFCKHILFVAHSLRQEEEDTTYGSD